MKEILRALTASGWTVLAILMALLVVLGWCSWDARRDARTAAEEIQADSRAQMRDSAARDTAADERLADARSNANLEKERADAVSALPDARPSDRRLARACVQLRQQGTREADLPAICRPEG